MGHRKPEAGTPLPPPPQPRGPSRRARRPCLFSDWDSAGGKPPLPPRPPFVSRASGPSSTSGKAPRPPSPPPPPYPMSEEVLASGMAVRDKWNSDKENRIDLKDVFNELMLECQRERSGETDQKAEAEGMLRQQNEQVNSPVLWPKKVKKPLWRKEIMFKMGVA
ncbi:uncharacterized protein [Miscanthus floridulus]|uniref:uncharacterized protein n=1 Tax=Miscanthus floridulus TaxID=154761 RepID=UPI003459BF29